MAQFCFTAKNLYLHHSQHLEAEQLCVGGVLLEDEADVVLIVADVGYLRHIAGILGHGCKYSFLIILAI